MYSKINKLKQHIVCHFPHTSVQEINLDQQNYKAVQGKYIDEEVTEKFNENIFVHSEVCMSKLHLNWMSISCEFKLLLHLSYRHFVLSGWDLFCSTRSMPLMECRHVVLFLRKTNKLYEGYNGGFNCKVSDIYIYIYTSYIFISLYKLTQHGQVLMHIHLCVNEQDQHWSRYWLVTCSVLLGNVSCKISWHLQ